MEITQLKALSDRFLDAWNKQDVEEVVACYTDDVTYLDPNTRGAVEGADALRRYLSKLFARWQMHWDAREEFPLEGVDGAAFLWRASFKTIDSDQTVVVDGMDLVVLEGDLIKRNEVYFDRAALASLMAS